MADEAKGHVQHFNSYIIMCTVQSYALSACQSINPDEVLECRFRHYFITQVEAPASWYHLFQQEVYKLLAALGLSLDEVESLLRSGRFVNFACDLLGNPSPQAPSDSDLN